MAEETTRKKLDTAIGTIQTHILGENLYNHLFQHNIKIKEKLQRTLSKSMVKSLLWYNKVIVTDPNVLVMKQRKQVTKQLRLLVLHLLFEKEGNNAELNNAWIKQLLSKSYPKLKDQLLLYKGIKNKQLGYDELLTHLQSDNRPDQILAFLCNFSLKYSYERYGVDVAHLDLEDTKYLNNRIEKFIRDNKNSLNLDNHYPAQKWITKYGSEALQYKYLPYDRLQETLVSDLERLPAVTSILAGLPLIMPTCLVVGSLFMGIGGTAGIILTTVTLFAAFLTPAAIPIYLGNRAAQILVELDIYEKIKSDPENCHSTLKELKTNPLLQFALFRLGHKLDDLNSPVDGIFRIVIGALYIASKPIQAVYSLFTGQKPKPSTLSAMSYGGAQIIKGIVDLGATPFTWSKCIVEALFTWSSSWFKPKEAQVIAKNGLDLLENASKEASNDVSLEAYSTAYKLHTDFNQKKPFGDVNKAYLQYPLKLVGNSNPQVGQEEIVVIEEKQNNSAPLEEYFKCFNPRSGL